MQALTQALNCNPNRFYSFTTPAATGPGVYWQCSMGPLHVQYWSTGGVPAVWLENAIVVPPTGSFVVPASGGRPRLSDRRLAGIQEHCLLVLQLAPVPYAQPKAPAKAAGSQSKAPAKAAGEAKAAAGDAKAPVGAAAGDAKAAGNQLEATQHMYFVPQNLANVNHDNNTMAFVRHRPLVSWTAGFVEFFVLVPQAQVVTPQRLLVDVDVVVRCRGAHGQNKDLVMWLYFSMATYSSGPARLRWHHLALQQYQGKTGRSDLPFQAELLHAISRRMEQVFDDLKRDSSQLAYLSGSSA